MAAACAEQGWCTQLLSLLAGAAQGSWGGNSSLQCQPPGGGCPGQALSDCTHLQVRGLSPGLWPCSHPRTGPCVLCSEPAMCITRGAPGWCCPALQRGLSAFSSRMGLMGTHGAICLPPREGMWSLAQVAKGAVRCRAQEERQEQDCASSELPGKSGSSRLMISSALCASKPKCRKRIHPRESRTGPSFVPVGPMNGVSSAQLCPQPMLRHRWSSKPTAWRRAGWLTSRWFELSGGDLWDTCCPQNLPCLPQHLPVHASLQFSGQNSHQISLRWRSSVLSPGLGPGWGLSWEGDQMLTSHLVCCPHSCPPLEKVSLRKKCPHLPSQGKQQKVSKLL